MYGKVTSERVNLVAYQIIVQMLVQSINTSIGLSKYSGIRIDENIMGINSLFFYENQKFGPQGEPFVFNSDFLEGVKVKFFRIISKQIPYFVSLILLY